MRVPIGTVIISLVKAGCCNRPTGTECIAQGIVPLN